jgi:uncharacterized protein (DUF1501 family)
MSSRRAFIKSGALAAFGISFGGVPSFIARAAGFNQILMPYQSKKILICIFQRGAMDGLMAVTPFTDDYLKKARPSLFMTPSASEKEKLFDLDGRFGLHPAFSPILPLFKNNQMSIVHGIGSPNNTRSHFDAQDYMETGTPFDKGTTSGWLNRAMGYMGHDASPFRAVSITSSMPRSLYGANPVVAVSSLGDFALRNKKNMPDLPMAATSFEELYDQTASGLIHDAGKETFEAVKMLSGVDVKKYQPANGAQYTNTQLGTSLKQLAQLIKANVGLEIGFAESTGWDTHFNQGTVNGGFAKSASDLSSNLFAFWTDLGSALQDQVTVMTMTEFGRTVKQNGSGGTDHGRASCNFIIGNDLNGGRVFGDLKPLAPENLDEGRDLAVTTDFRSVFSDVAVNHLKLKQSNALFPGWTGESTRIISF